MLILCTSQEEYKSVPTEVSSQAGFIAYKVTSATWLIVKNQYARDPANSGKVTSASRIAGMVAAYMDREAVSYRQSW